jgi:ketosteroid isomerase-like protein
VRKLVIGGVVAFMVILVACSSPSEDPALAEAQRKADMWEIDQIEKSFHEATTKKDLDLMMSLWAPNATMTVGPAQTATGVDEIRRFWVDRSDAFETDNYWISDHPAYKVEITVNGDRGTLHFECHYLDAKTGEVVLTTVADLDVARVDGRWVIANMVAGSTDLTI